ncbi:MAG: hypothetical protein IKU71_06550 [Kiritimatiellae bacterium]|nr:hypothetical protein [Kiritimatiellia bacterium]
MTGRSLKPLLLRAAAFSALVLLVAVSAVVIVRRNAATPVDTRQILSITRNGRTVTFVECPECEKTMRVASDGMSATINLCRLWDGNPDATEFARRRDAAVEQAFLLMAEKGGDESRSKEPDKGKDK